MPRQTMRKRWNAAGLLALSRRCFEGMGDGTPVRTYRLVDCLMSAVAVFGLKSPSLLQLDREVRLDGRVRGNLRRLYQVGRVPCDTRMRTRLDRVPASALRPVFRRLFRELQRGKMLKPYAVYGHPYLLSLDGTVFFIGCRALQVLLRAASPQRHGHLSPSDAGRCDRASGLSGRDPAGTGTDRPAGRSGEARLRAQCLETVSGSVASGAPACASDRAGGRPGLQRTASGSAGASELAVPDQCAGARPCGAVPASGGPFGGRLRTRARRDAPWTASYGW